MVEKQVTIVNQGGLHARPAAAFVAAARKYVSRIRLEDLDTGRWADGRSILMVLALRLTEGANVILSAEGKDEEQAVEELAALLESRF